jgi:hypothetical protein
MLIRSARAAGVVMLALGLIAPTVATARAGGAVEITLDANFLTDGSETFTATGAFCPSGSGSTDDLRIVGNGAHALSFHVVKTLTCANGTDSITIKVNAATHQGSAGDQGGWSVKGGTGAFAGAKGGGVIVGVYDDSGVIDVYSGRITR